jgi:iron complex transport system substrate-binding protein
VGQPATRIVSLLPSATEICFALGLDENIVGVTHECDYPASAQSKPQITRSKTTAALTSREIDTLVRSQLDETGSIYELDLEMLEALRPDIILTQQLCTVCAVSFDYVAEQAATLTTVPQVINLEPKSLEDVFHSIARVAALVGQPEKAEAMLSGLRTRVDHVREAVALLPKRKAMVLEWIDPPFASGHWIPELVALAGGENTIGFLHAPSREVSWEKILASLPEVLIVAECGFGVERQLQDIDFLLSRVGSDIPEIWVCDGSQYFSRPGPRLVDTLEMISGILHVELREQMLSKFQNTKDIVRIH